MLWQNAVAPTQYWIHLLSMSGAVIGGGGITTASGYVPLTHALRRLPPGWTGHISCSKKLTQGTSVTGMNCPSGDNVPDETHDWYVGGPQVGNNIPTFFVAKGSWCQGQWTINTSTNIQMGFSSPANVPSFDRTANFFSMSYVGMPMQTFHEFDFPSILGRPMPRQSLAAKCIHSPQGTCRRSRTSRDDHVHLGLEASLTTPIAIADKHRGLTCS